MNKKLTEKQKRFVDEYLVDLNATRAYKVAYPGCRKDEVDASNANRLLKKDKVSAYLQQRMEALRKRTEITQDRVLRELAKVALAEGADNIALPFRMADKLKALELIARHLGMFTDKFELAGKNGGPIQHQHQHSHKIDLTKLTDEELQVLERIIRTATDT